MEHDEIFGQVERELDLAFGALFAGDAQALTLQTAAVMARSQYLLQNPVAWPRERLLQTAMRVQSLREAVLRHAAMADQALQTLVPATQSHTYGVGAAGGGGAASPYGAVARASGRMAQVLTA
jgi:hypothetical protein